MSDLPRQTAPQLPLFHRRIVPLDSSAHAALRLNRSAGYRYSSEADFVPIGLEEFQAAGLFYPILFTGGEQPVPVALLGIHHGHNLFVDRAGSWMPNAYVPAFIRAYPFVFLDDDATDTRCVGIEAEAECLSTEHGLKLFDEGQPTITLTEAIGFCESCRVSLEEARSFGEALDEAGLLETRDATISFSQGETARITGFRAVESGRLDEVSDAIFLEWRRRGWLTALFAHLMSAGNWAQFIELAASNPRIMQ
jgi:hypothetical protein